MRIAATAAIDLVLIVAFAALGRRTHDEGAGLAGTLTVAGPFLIGYAVAATVFRLDRAPWNVRRGALVAIVGVGLGLGLRGVVFDRGLAPAFVVVAFVAVTALLVGWRLIAQRLGTHRGDRRQAT